MLAIIDSSDRAAVDALLDRRPSRDPALRRRVASIVAAVATRGDEALMRFARRFDGLAGSLEVSREEMEEGAREVPAAARRALAVAAKHIRIVARAQLPRTRRVAVAPGLAVTERVTPLDRVGCYVPGGRYPLPSSLLMTVVPAKVAGVPEVFVACPRPAPIVMAAAIEAGATRLFRMGGAQAVAAFAYGTATIPRVDKIVGPGNRYVAAAKDLVQADCAIDFHAGPSEVVILSTSAPPAWVAADLIAQAEHDPDARALLLTTRRSYATQVAREVARALPDVGPAGASLFQHGAIVICRNDDEAVELANRIAPEHILCSNPALAWRLSCAGTIFVGDVTVPAAGDYATGSNHVLPTAGAARFRGGLNAADFVRVVAVQEMNTRALAALAPIVTLLAREEGLEAHARSVEARTAGSSRQRTEGGRAGGGQRAASQITKSPNHQIAKSRNQ